MKMKKLNLKKLKKRKVRVGGRMMDCYQLIHNFKYPMAV